MHRSAKERQRYVVLSLFIGLRSCKNGPRAVETDIDRQLRLFLVLADSCSVNTNDFADILADWQIFEFLGKKDD